ncbi:MAG: NAD(P)-binding domain-containing protein [Syntrophales bacterium LBB04]|nr:NAD(P)-binding domain-containing protein [Syntrophales bacterium LBB04]
MDEKTVGFIGAGRITRILMGGLRRAGKLPWKVVVSDTNAEILQTLKNEFSGVDIALNGNRQAASQDLIFIALHPPVMSNSLAEIRSDLKPTSILISLAPKLAIRKISDTLNGFQRIVRMIPNAPSIVNEGYNPVVFHPALAGADKESLLTMFKLLGDSPEVDEEKLESYAILTAMGPTYLWFQLYELVNLGRQFGLTDQELHDGIPKMLAGAVKTMFESGLSPEEVMNLIPVKPLGEEEANIKDVYRSKLTALYQKLKS